MDNKQDPISELSEKQLILKSELDAINSKIDSLSKYSIQTSNTITDLKQRYERLEKIKNDIHIKTIALEEKVG